MSKQSHMLLNKLAIVYLTIISGVASEEQVGAYSCGHRRILEAHQQTLQQI